MEWKLSSFSHAGPETVSLHNIFEIAQHKSNIQHFTKNEDHHSPGQFCSDEGLLIDIYIFQITFFFPE